MSLVARSYAKGLFLAAAKQNGDILAAVEAFNHAVEGSAEYRLFMRNPAVPAQAKKSVIRKLSQPEMPATALNFLCLLIDKRRFELLPRILEEYRAMVAEEENILIITVTSAYHLTEEQKDEVADHYRRRYGAERAWVENRVVESLVGGIQVRIGDTLTDDSISGRLRKLAAAINH